VEVSTGSGIALAVCFRRYEVSMDANPYAPPKAAVADVSASTGLKKRRVITMFVFLIFTAGMYYMVWFFRRRAALNRLNSPKKLQLWPLIAFTAGHPFRIRYMVPLVAACGVLAGVALSALPRRAWSWAAGALVALSLWISPPFSLKSPMPVEAQWETPMRLERQRVTEVLRARYDGTPILASMGSLGHYMQESSSIGLHLRNFVHEGNGDLWTEAVRSPRRSVRWVLVEERAEGGDMLAGLARKDPAFLAGFTRVAEGGGLALYERKTDSGSRFP